MPLLFALARYTRRLESPGAGADYLVEGMNRANSGGANREACMAAGAHGWLRKPVTHGSVGALLDHERKPGLVSALQGGAFATAIVTEDFA